MSNGLLNSTVMLCGFTVHVWFCIGAFSRSKNAGVFVVLIKRRNLRRKGSMSEHNSNFSIVVKVFS